MAIGIWEELHSEFEWETADETEVAEHDADQLDDALLNFSSGLSPDMLSDLLAELSAEYPDEFPAEPGPEILARPPDPLSENAEELLTPQNPSKERSLLREFGALGIKIGTITGVIVLIFTFVYGFHYNVEPGMNPAIKDGDLVMYYRWNKRYRAGDLILLTFQGQRQVRRVVAVAGDTVDITAEGLVINGALQQEPEISQITERYAEGIVFPVTLGEGEVFVLGDARENATDSRIYGPVKIRDIKGKIITSFRRRNL